MREGVLRVLVADDHPLYRDGIVAAVNALETAEVVAAASDGPTAVVLSAELKPDVVLMDIAMPGLDGIQATARIVADQPQVAVLMLTMSENDDSVVAALRAGARGYLVKGADRAEIASALEAVSRGQAVFGGGVAPAVLGRLVDPPRARGGSARFPQLTERELEVLDLLALGLGNHAIAQRLFLSDKTVRNHVSNILAKLPASDRHAAAALARAVPDEPTSTL